MLVLNDIRKNYPLGPVEVEVLKGVNLKVSDGELLSIMGQSGCGKSTLMNIMGLLDKPTSGFFSINDKEITYKDDDHLSGLRNNHIGFVFQQYFLLSKLTALENVGVPLVYRGESSSKIKKKSMEYLAKVGMAERAHHRPNQLSGGQQQRVAIARALVGGPALILADEPTGALDTRVGEEIMELFKKVNKEEGITMIIITHDPDIAEQCTRYVNMKDGRILES
jgi:putative ABC transport system ATP-binding protein